MKFIKKIIGIVIIVAVCCAIIVPMTADASSSKCSPHRSKIQNRQNSVVTTTHPYLYGTMINEDGIEEYIYKDCTITITIDRYELECQNCNRVLEQQGLGEKKTHSKCDF